MHMHMHMHIHMHIHAQLANHCLAGPPPFGVVRWIRAILQGGKV